MGEDRYPIAAEHPDLALLAHAQRRGICCLVLQGADSAQLDALCLPGVFCVYRQEDRAALLYAQDLGFAGIPALEAELSRLGLEAGLSGPFELPASARGCMQKAALALETGRKGSSGCTIYPMDEFVEAALLAAAERSLAVQGFAAADFYDAALWRMAQADAAKDTNYLESLYAYLSCGMDMKRAAQLLHVHRNTLSYRMERAQALFGFDLKDVNRCFELLFSLWLWRHLPGGQDMDLCAPFDGHAAQAALWRHVERSGDGEPVVKADFPCALLCVGASSLADDERNALLCGLRGAAPEEAVFAFDEDVLLAALSPLAAQTFAETAGALCAKAGCPLVCSQEFPVSRIEQHAQICRMALCAGQGNVAHTRDICSALLFMAMERKISLSPYLCEDVIRVMDEDARKGTFLSRSLYAYLLHFRDLKRAAQTTGMHRNTMEYHIRKIDALIGSDMDGTKRFMMMCTYKMLALPDMGRYGM